MNQALQDIYVPYFNTFMNSNIIAGLFDLEGRLVACTPRGADSIAIPMNDLIGLSYKEITTQMVKRMCDIKHNSEVIKIINVFKQIAKIHEIVVTEKKIIHYLDFLPYKNCYDVEIVTFLPAFDLVGNVIGAQALSNKYYMFGLIDHLNSLKAGREYELSLLHNNKTTLDLSNRQHEILFLLCYGMSQQEIAFFLDISRSTIGKAIQRASQKFGHTYLNLENLLKDARRMKLHEYIPKTFNQPRIIILDAEIKKKYF